MPPPTTIARIALPFLTDLESFDFRKDGTMTSERQAAIAGVGLAMQRYQRATQAFDDAVGRALGLGPADLRCLDWLTEGPRTAGELAVAAGLRPAATTALVDRLERRGLLRRTPDAADRRRVLVELTDEGRARTWAAYGPLVDEGAGLFDDIPAAQLDAMTALLGRMTELTERHRQRVDGAG
jgi:DNA-binding MarR family transcriptional regulator